MDTLLTVIFVIVIFFLFLFLTVTFLDRKSANELKGKSVADLENLVFRYETEYFRFIGEDHQVVRDFRQAIEDRDVSAIDKNWLTFRANFTALERKAGHKDRPLIMDYYYGYELQLEELRRKLETRQ